MNPVIAMVLFGNAGSSRNTARRFSPRWLMLAASYSELGREGELIKFLDGFLDKQADPVALQLISRLVAETEGADRAIQYVRDRLAAQPSLAAVAVLLEIEVETNQFDPAMLSDIEKIREVLLAHLANNSVSNVATAATKRGSCTGFVPGVIGGIVSSRNLKRGADGYRSSRSHTAPLDLAACHILPQAFVRFMSVTCYTYRGSLD